METRKLKKFVMSFVGCVHQTWRALHFMLNNRSPFQMPCKFFKPPLSAFTWMTNRLIQGMFFFQTSSLQFSDIVDDLAITSTFGDHAIIVQALDPRYVFLFKLRAPTLFTLSTTLGLHLDSCKM